jgi:hypothetical protein
MAIRGEEARIVVPVKDRVGHEAHFAQATHEFLGCLRRPKALPSWEKSSPLVNCYICTKEDVELSRESGPSHLSTAAFALVSRSGLRYNDRDSFGLQQMFSLPMESAGQVSRLALREEGVGAVCCVLAQLQGPFAWKDLGEGCIEPRKAGESWTIGFRVRLADLPRGH